MVPELVKIGSIILYNFDSCDKTHLSVKFCGYYLMPKYEMNLVDYLSGLRGIDKV